MSPEMFARSIIELYRECMLVPSFLFTQLSPVGVSRGLKHYSKTSISFKIVTPTVWLNRNAGKVNPNMSLHWNCSTAWTPCTGPLRVCVLLNSSPVCFHSHICQPLCCVPANLGVNVVEFGMTNDRWPFTLHKHPMSVRFIKQVIYTLVLLSTYPKHWEYFCISSKNHHRSFNQELQSLNTNMAAFSCILSFSVCHVQWVYIQLIRFILNFYT